MTDNPVDSNDIGQGRGRRTRKGGELVSLREEVKRLKQFEDYVKKNHPELVVAYEMERRLERDDTLAMDEVDNILLVFE